MGSKYIVRSVPERETRLNTRSSHGFPVPFCRLSCYQNSFFPSTIKCWNLLPSCVIQSVSISCFKVALKLHLKLGKNTGLSKTLSYFSCGKLGRVLTQMRLGLSPLNYHLFQYNINDNPFCAQCGSEFETSIHFFALCSSYDVDRVILRNSIRLLHVLPLLPDFLCHTINIDNDECFVKLLYY